MTDFGPIQRRRNRAGSESSSSDESFRERPIAPRRPLSPAATDDGDATMDPVENDDTPPPASRPLIRQAVAFSSDKPLPSISTYEAEVPETIPEADRFLPGQKVPIPGQEPPERPDKHSKATVKKRQEAYPGQTTKFRLNTSYDPKFIITTPHDKGEGAQFRNLNRSPPPSGYEDSIANAALMAIQNTEAHETDAYRKPRKPRGPNKPKQQHTLEAMIIDLAPGTEPRTVKQTIAKKPLVPSNDNWHYHDPDPELEPEHDPEMTMSTRQESMSSSGTYYRRDYEADRAAHGSESPRPGSSGNNRPTHYNSSSHNDSSLHNSSSSKRHVEKRPAKLLRMVTVLISDTRSGKEDPQLVEVKVPLKPSDDPDDGFWADAEDISQALQSGPWRIDGPARAFVLRGRYRQIIMRVTTDNKDEYLSANVVVRNDRTLELIVELPPPIGVPPPQPMIPNRLMEPAYNAQKDPENMIGGSDSNTAYSSEGRPKMGNEPPRPGYIAPFAASMDAVDPRRPQQGHDPRQMQADEQRRLVPSHEPRPYPPMDPRQAPPPHPGPTDHRQYPLVDPRQVLPQYDPRVYPNADPRVTYYPDPRYPGGGDPRQAPPPPPPVGPLADSRYPMMYPPGQYPGMVDARQHPGGHLVTGGAPRPYPVGGHVPPNPHDPRDHVYDAGQQPEGDPRQGPPEARRTPNGEIGHPPAYDPRQLDPTQQPGQDPRKHPFHDTRQSLPPPDRRQLPHHDPRQHPPHDPRQLPYHDPRQAPPHDPRLPPPNNPMQPPPHDLRQLPPHDPRLPPPHDPMQPPPHDPRLPPPHDPRQPPPHGQAQQDPRQIYNGDPRTIRANSKQSNGDPRRHKHTYSDGTISDRMDVDPPRQPHYSGPPAPPPQQQPTNPQESRQRTGDATRDSRKRINEEAFDDYDGPANHTPVLAKAARQDYDWQNSPRQMSRHDSPKPDGANKPNSRAQQSAPQAYGTPSGSGGRMAHIDQPAVERTHSSTLSEKRKDSSAPERMPERPPWERPSPSPNASERISQRHSRERNPGSEKSTPQERERMPEAPPWERAPEKSSHAERQAALERANAHPNTRLPPRSPSPQPQPLYATRSDHPNPPDMAVKEDAFIVDVGNALGKEKSYSTFFRSQARNRVQDVVFQYKFVTENPLIGKMIDGWDTPVSEHHILEAMKINQVDFLKNYKETLHLLSLYGPTGRNENAEVVTMLKDEHSVGPHGNAHKRLIHLLRKVDQEHSKKRP